MRFWLRKEFLWVISRSARKKGLPLMKYWMPEGFQNGRKLWIIGIWFIVVRDGLRKPGASPGKRLFHLKVVPWNKPYRPEKTVTRNIFLIIPLLNVVVILIEGVVLLLTKNPSRLIGDRMAGMRVVHAGKTSLSDGA